jgi:hypothetical protein
VNNLDAPDAHFDYSSFFSDAQVEKGGKLKKMWKQKEMLRENQRECHEIEPNPSKEVHVSLKPFSRTETLPIHIEKSMFIGNFTPIFLQTA